MSRLGEAIRNAAWKHGSTLKDAAVAERVATEIEATVGPTDEALRALVRGAARAAIELVWENVEEGAELANVYLDRAELAEAVTDATMECAKEDPESEVHAVRRLG